MERTAIVTGAASGIGRASALLFAREGASLALVDRASFVSTTSYEKLPSELGLVSFRVRKSDRPTQGPSRKVA